jgi:hypothetical protein
MGQRIREKVPMRSMEDNAAHEEGGGYIETRPTSV